MMRKFLMDNLRAYRLHIFDKTKIRVLMDICKLVEEADKLGNKLILAGNGASAAIASHCAVDFTKQANVRAVCFNEASLITCFSNDYGYDMWIVEALKHYADPGDVVILISSSGRSPNVVNAAKYARENNLKVVSFTGFDSDNPLRKLSDISLWIDSHVYNIVECVHMIFLTMVIDCISERKSALMGDSALAESVAVM
ncbi:MAG: phosphoheptose isomerase [Candidatus Neomarinimicrobiota bacterium]|nr:MAG: phosphoheptose isomerase [Candidatus Neomarinimicrobiota bacterium]